MVSTIHCQDNLSSKAVVYWSVIKDAGIISFNVYCAKRKSDTFTFYKNVPNVASMDDFTVHTLVDRSALPITVGDSENYYLNYTTIDKTGTESVIDPTNIKVIYPKGVQLRTDPHLTEVDEQTSSATNVDFRTTDRFNGLLMAVSISRSLATAIDVIVSVYHDGYEVEVGRLTGTTDKSIFMDLNQNVILNENSVVRVQTTGVSGGSFIVKVGRRRIYLPTMGV